MSNLVTHLNLRDIGDVSRAEKSLLVIPYFYKKIKKKNVYLNKYVVYVTAEKRACMGQASDDTVLDTSGWNRH